jgi:hypothetical protein
VYYICRTLDVRVTVYLRRTLLAPLAAVLVLGAGWLAVVQSLDLTTWRALIAAGAAGLAGYGVVGLLVEVGAGRLIALMQTYVFLSREAGIRIEPALVPGFGETARTKCK